MQFLDSGQGSSDEESDSANDFPASLEDFLVEGDVTEPESSSENESQVSSSSFLW
jgi:hypothetical protein